jgi:hypothetical protein
VFGTKARLLRAAIDVAIRGDDEPLAALQRDWAARAQTLSSVEEFLAVVGRVLADAEHRSAGLVVVASEAANVDSAMTDLAEQLRRQRAHTAAWIVDGLRRRSPLRPGINRGRAIDTVWTLIDPHVFSALTRHRGWTVRQFERWFIDSTASLLVAPAAPVPLDC